MNLVFLERERERERDGKVMKTNFLQSTFIAKVFIVNLSLSHSQKSD